MAIFQSLETKKKYIRIRFVYENIKNASCPVSCAKIIVWIDYSSKVKLYCFDYFYTYWNVNSKTQRLIF